jgi:hypothetical protein
MPSQQQKIFQDLHDQEALRGDHISYRVRWIFLTLVLVMVGAMIFSDRYLQAAWAGAGFLGLAAGYNFLLGRFLRQGRVPAWMRYLSTSCDIILITGYNYVLSVYVTPLGVSTTATMFAYPIILLFVALRLDKAQLAYAIALTLLCFNLPYFLRYPHLDPKLLAQVVSSDIAGHLFKSTFLLGYGLALFFIARTLHRLIAKQAGMYEEQIAAEERHLANLEAQVQLRTRELTQTNQDLRQALAQVKTLSGLLPICSHCKNIRDDQGYWQGVEQYIAAHSQAGFSHGICPECLVKHFPEFSDILADNPRALDKESEEA